MGYTKGPFIANVECAGWYEMEATFFEVTDENDVIVAFVKEWGDAKSESIANARLFAAAPCLLELLIEARSTLEMWKDVAPAISLCADIDRAIARAKGEAE